MSKKVQHKIFVFIQLNKDQQKLYELLEFLKNLKAYKTKD